MTYQTLQYDIPQPGPSCRGVLAGDPWVVVGWGFQPGDPRHEGAGRFTYMLP